MRMVPNVLVESWEGTWMKNIYSSDRMYLLEREYERGLANKGYVGMMR